MSPIAETAPTASRTSRLRICGCVSLSEPVAPPRDDANGSLGQVTTHRMSGDHSSFDFALFERPGQLAPRADVELRIDLAQLVLDRADAEEQRLRDVAV